MSIVMTIREIAERFANVTDVSDPLFVQFDGDHRIGVQKIIKKTLKRLKEENERQHEFFNRFKYEKELWHKGIKYVAGVDEVGRGPLAGPVVAGAAILPSDFDLVDVNDSKQLSDEKRRELVPLIQKEAIAYSCVPISSQIIDEINIYEATRVAMKKAVYKLDPQPGHIIVDAMTIANDIPQTRLIKGDAKSISVAAASILAKVFRDNLMDEYAVQYPRYGFEHNAGYGTKQHLLALAKYGPTPIHRKTFSPVLKTIHH